MDNKSLENRQWWNYVEEDLQELLKQSILLLKLMKKRETYTKEEEDIFHDFAFIVFPAAKAYEGYLKTIFKDTGFITGEDYYGRHFRVGKALNPDLDKRFRNESVYDKVVEFCGNRDLADRMWEVWKRGRNLTFHWFPNERNAIDLDEAESILMAIFDTMDLVWEGCKIKK